MDPSGRVREDYVHETDELVMVLEGDLEDAFIPARALHSVRNRGRTTARRL